MKFANMIQLMTVKQHTKFRVLADENFSNVDTKFKSGKQEVDMQHPRLSHTQYNSRVLKLYTKFQIIPISGC